MTVHGFIPGDRIQHPSWARAGHAAPVFVVLDLNGCCLGVRRGDGEYVLLLPDCSTTLIERDCGDPVTCECERSEG